MNTASISLAVLGRPESEAIKMIEDAGFKWRITGRDGKHYMLTQDHKPHDRINIAITGGVVIEANPG